MSHEIEHIAASQETSHQVGGGCNALLRLTPLCVCVCGDKRACSQPLSLYLIVMGTLQIVFGGLQTLSKGDRQSVTGKVGGVMQGFAMVWSFLGIYWAFSTNATLCTARLYYTSMVFAWLTVLYVCCMCCFVVFMAGAMAGNMAKEDGAFGAGASEAILCSSGTHSCCPGHYSAQA